MRPRCLTFAGKRTTSPPQGKRLLRHDSQRERLSGVVALKVILEADPVHGAFVAGGVVVQG
jgi:hypothetical protein